MTSPAPATIRILVADDHPVVRDGLKRLLTTQPDFETVGEAGTGRDAVGKALSLKPDIVLLDLLMPDMDGLTALDQIRAQLPATRVIVLTTFAQRQQVVRAAAAGAAGYLLKDVEVEELARAVRGAAHGQRYFHPEAAQFLDDAIPTAASRTPPPHAALTERERSVLRELASGRSNKEIATSLTISTTTVKGHVASILNKLGVEDRTQAAIYAVKHGLVE